MYRYFSEMGLSNTIVFLTNKLWKWIRSKTPTNPQIEKFRKNDFLNLWKENISEKQRIAVVVSTFYDLNGRDYMQGGAERYIVELSKIIHTLGASLEVYQCGNQTWHKIHEGIHVFGLNTNGYNIKRLNEAYHDWVPKPTLSIYFQLLLASPKFNTPSICVSHGVDWDAHWLQKDNSKYTNLIHDVLSSCKNVNIIVSVDTNTINWLRATDYDLSEKCVYIPNFVDLNKFNLIKKEGKEEVTILFPRRLTDARGFWLIQKIIPDLLSRYENISIEFCGKAEKFEEVEVKKLTEKYDGKIKWYDTAPDKMGEVYQNADIVIIPTRYSEGTSLSCLEALASGKPVIVTNVGGLTDIVLAEFNGTMIEPNSSELFNSICRLIENPNLREKLSANALISVQSFNLSLWQNRWIQILKKYINLYE